MKPEHLHVLAATMLATRVGPLPSTVIDRWMLERIQQAVAGARIHFVLWDGFQLSSKAGPPVATVIIKSRRVLLSWLWNPDLHFGEAYMFGAIEVRGDLVALLEEVYRARPGLEPGRTSPSQPNDISIARDNVHSHYDLGNDFYRLWLDRNLVYTCAYFPKPDCRLDDAQMAKMDLVCRKLRLTPGERVIEAGCGWGALALFMAERYSVTVRAFNLSTEQIAYARECARQRGLADRVDFIEDDYRNVQGDFDVFVSVGMLEHVGLSDYPTLGRVIDRSLTPRGRGLLHFIGRNQPGPLNPWIRKRIFPGAYAPTLPEVCERVLQPNEFSVLDVENLRLHYAKTLEHWSRQFEAAADTVARMFDDVFVRAWRLYLAGSQAAFTTGTMQLFQVVFARSHSNAIPWTRAED
jgi:cyclopropane-fatty-acyl-phospholipid synthase